jgi:D-serine deaminase-like pyridoxal phosphate-dependent protein
MPLTTTEFPALEKETDVLSPSLSRSHRREFAQHACARRRSDAAASAHQTHKLLQIVARQVELGIKKCKAATIAEAEMAARAGVMDVILAGQMVGPNVARFIALMRTFPRVAFSILAADAEVIVNQSRGGCRRSEG